MSAAGSAVGIVLSLLAFGVVGRVQSRLDRPDEGIEPHLWKWLVPVVVCAYVLLVESRTLASVGWRVDGPVTFAVQVVGGLGTMVGSSMLTAPLRARLDGGDELAEGLSSFASLSIPERLFVAGTAGVTEEVPYRGYVIERGAELTGRPLLAAGLSTAAFLYAHVGETWTVGAAVQMLQPTVVLVAVYLWTHSLPVVIAVHALNDAVGLLLADRYADKRPEAAT